ncbi:hypothetical protein RHIZ404_200112 [Rhizobium sp. EC-SD404]|nr:hypothetical protein RHIZ404_200112 [Rhizobium sp. EC-SD404]
MSSFCSAASSSPSSPPSWLRPRSAPMLAGMACRTIFPMTSSKDMPGPITLKTASTTAAVRSPMVKATQASRTSSCQSQVSSKPIRRASPTRSGSVTMTSIARRKRSSVKPSHQSSIVISIGSEKISAPPAARPMPTIFSRKGACWSASKPSLRVDTIAEVPMGAHLTFGAAASSAKPTFKPMKTIAQAAVRSG